MNTRKLKELRERFKYAVGTYRANNENYSVFTRIDTLYNGGVNFIDFVLQASIYNADGPFGNEKIKSISIVCNRIKLGISEAKMDGYDSFEVTELHRPGSSDRIYDRYKNKSYDEIQEYLTDNLKMRNEEDGTEYPYFPLILDIMMGLKKWLYTCEQVKEEYDNENSPKSIDENKLKSIIREATIKSLMLLEDEEEFNKIESRNEEDNRMCEKAHVMMKMLLGYFGLVGIMKETGLEQFAEIPAISRYGFTHAKFEFYMEEKKVDKLIEFANVVFNPDMEDRFPHIQEQKEIILYKINQLQDNYNSDTEKRLLHLIMVRLAEDFRKYLREQNLLDFLKDKIRLIITFDWVGTLEFIFIRPAQPGGIAYLPKKSDSNYIILV